MASLTVQGSGVTDTFMDSAAPTDINDTSANFNIGENNAAVATYRELAKFDFSSIPAGATVDSAILTLTVKNDISDNARTISVYRVKRVWVANQTNWNQYATASNWGTAGCGDTTNDREATDIGTAAQPASPSVDSEITINLTAAKIQEMISGGVFTNNGFLLKVDTETDDAIQYYSTDDAATTKRPKLVVNYSVPEGGYFHISV